MLLRWGKLKEAGWRGWQTSELSFEHVWLEMPIKQLREMLYRLSMNESEFERDIMLVI